MARTTLRWIMIAIAALVIGPIAAWLCRPMRGTDGGMISTVLVSSAVGPAVIGTLLAMAMATLFGAIVSRMLGWRLGCFVAGAALAWPAWEHAGVVQLLRESGDPSIMLKMAIEGAALLGIALGAAFLLYRVDPGIDRKPDAIKGAVSGVGGVIAAMLAAATLAGFVVLIVAIEEQRAQAFAAAAVAAIAAGTVARFIGPSPSPSAAMLGLLLAAIAAPLLTMRLAGPDLIEAAYNGSMLNLGRLTPMLWASGALVGVPIGSAWAESMFERQPQTTAATR